LGNPTGLGDAAGDLAAFNLMVSNGDTALAAGNYDTAVQDYQAAGSAGAVTIGPEIDAQTGGASTSYTQHAWTANGQLAAIPSSGATAANAQAAQLLAHNMQSWYQSGLSATAATAQTPRDVALDAAAGALLQRLQTGGCTTASFQECTDFQNAWNTAGGTPAITVDGKYGSQTQASLQGALNIGPNQPPQAAPASCFLATTVTPVSLPAPTTTTTTSTSAPKNWTPWIIGGVIAAGALGGLYVYKKKHGRMPRFA
jgi:hypothetical protein